MTLLLLALLSLARSFSCTLELPVTGAIGPATLDFIERGLEVADEENCSSVLLAINTPGGSLHSTRLIVETILNSKVPVLCLVKPEGAHAGSAGAIIMQACHVSGAFRATNIGAATPIMATGEKISEDLRKKMINDTKSWLDSLTELRKRNEQFGRDIVTDAKAVSADEALKIGAIDVVSSNTEDFLKFAQGKKVRMSADVEGVVQVGPLQVMEPDLRFKVLHMLSDPEISYLMFMGSLGLLYFEVTHPGTIVPGVLGSIGLVVSLMSLHKMDIYWGGLALIVLGLLLFGLELFIPSFGVLGAGGTVAFVLGSLFLFDPRSGYAIPLSTIVVTALIMASFLGLIVWLALGSRDVKKRTAYDDLPNAEGVVVKLDDSSGLSGQIRVIGEIWRFESQVSLTVGETVRVKGHHGLTVEVDKPGG